MFDFFYKLQEIKVKKKNPKKKHAQTFSKITTQYF